MTNGTPGPNEALTPAAEPASGAQSLLGQLRSNPMLMFMIAGVISLLIVAALLLWAQAPEYRVIYSNLNEADGGRIVRELETRGVPYQLGSGGQTLLVPAEQVHVLRLQLAEQGLPQGGNVGFELLDNQAFGVSQFAEQVNFQRGLEGELARSIESLGPVARARVHLAMGRQSVFVREREPASASVVLTLHSGRNLGESQVNGIVHMVSSSVPGLSADAVTVVDQGGRLLSLPQTASRDLDGTQLTYIEEVERSYQRRIENILVPIFGKENVRAQVVAQIDFSTREQTAERFGPNQPPNEAAVRSQQISVNYLGGETPPRGVPGALTNTPPNLPAPAEGQAEANVGGAAQAQGAEGEATAIAPEVQGAGIAPPSSPPSLKRDQLINYEVDRSIEHVQHQRGNIQRLTAAVVINYRERINEEGEALREPLDEAELERINRLVRQAMGFSPTRGDALEIINSPFAERDGAIEAVEWWQTPEFFQLASSLSRYLLVAFVALLLWLMVLRPIKRRHQETLAAAAAAEAAAREAAAAELGLPSPGATGEPGEPGTPEGEEALQQLRKKRRKSSVYEQNLQTVREMAKEDPRLVAMIVKTWMSKQDD